PPAEGEDLLSARRQGAPAGGGDASESGLDVGSLDDGGDGREGGPGLPARRVIASGDGGACPPPALGGGEAGKRVAHVDSQEVRGGLLVGVMSQAGPAPENGG